MATRKKTVLITGCSSGIGHALAREFNSRGLTVLATARKAESISDLSAQGITALSLDVDKPESILALKDEVTRLTDGKVDYLINNAGRNYTVPALDLDINEVEQTFRTNLFGVMRMCQAFAPLVIAAKGTIVQIGSLASLMPYVFGSAYNASKAALHAYSDTLRVELAPFDVRVVIIVTGGVKSQIARLDRVLKEDSIYVPIEPEYIRRTKHSQEVGIPAEEYAKRVVNKLLGWQTPQQIWAGYGVWLVWFASTFLPKSVLSLYFYRKFNLWKLAKPGTAKKAT